MKKKFSLFSRKPTKERPSRDKLRQRPSYTDFEDDQKPPRLHRKLGPSYTEKHPSVSLDTLDYDEPPPLPSKRSSSYTHTMEPSKHAILSSDPLGPSPPEIRGKRRSKKHATEHTLSSDLLDNQKPPPGVDILKDHPRKPTLSSDPQKPHPVKGYARHKLSHGLQEDQAPPPASRKRAQKHATGLKLSHVPQDAQEPSSLPRKLDSSFPRKSATDYSDLQKPSPLPRKLDSSFPPKSATENLLHSDFQDNQNATVHSDLQNDQKVPRKSATEYSDLQNDQNDPFFPRKSATENLFYFDLPKKKFSQQDATRGEQHPHSNLDLPSYSDHPPSYSEHLGRGQQPPSHTTKHQPLFSELQDRYEVFSKPSSRQWRKKSLPAYDMETIEPSMLIGKLDPCLSSSSTLPLSSTPNPSPQAPPLIPPPLLKLHP